MVNHNVGYPFTKLNYNILYFDIRVNANMNNIYITNIYIYIYIYNVNHNKNITKIVIII